MDVVYYTSGNLKKLLPKPKNFIIFKTTNKKQQLFMSKGKLKMNTTKKIENIELAETIGKNLKVLARKNPAAFTKVMDKDAWTFRADLGKGEHDYAMSMESVEKNGHSRRKFRLTENGEVCRLLSQKPLYTAFWRIYNGSKKSALQA